MTWKPRYGSVRKVLRVVGQFELLRLLNRLFRLIVRLRLNDPSLHKHPREPPEPRAVR